MNFIVNGTTVALIGTTPLKDGRMRAIFAGVASAKVGDSGQLRVELTRPGHSVLTDEKAFEIVKVPATTKPAGKQVSVPKIDPRPVSPEDEMWQTLDWPADAAMVASESELETGILVIWYSTVFPNYANQLAALEKQDLSLARSFTTRYTIWLAVHSLLLQQEETGETLPAPGASTSDEDGRDRMERCRVAALSAMFAMREVKDLKVAAVEVE